jgi:hypothetical protein
MKLCIMFRVRLRAAIGLFFVIQKAMAQISPFKRDRRGWRRSWLHLDLYTDCQQEEVRRLLTIGAKQYPWRNPESADYVVLQDPDGNLFCGVQKSQTS